MLGGEPAPGAAAATLAERFYYPKLGPGQLWEEAARRIVAAGGEIRLRTRLVGLRRCGDRIAAAIARDEDSRELTTLPGDFFFSSAPVGELIAALGDGVPEVIGEAASLLRHRSFIVVGLLLARLAMKGAAGSLPPDNWIYVQDGDVDAGRIQIFNNWSPALVADPRLVWVGVEYFCAEGDRRWTAADADLASHAAAELGRLGLADPTDRLDAVVVRAPKAYPAYIGEGWRRFGEVRAFLDEIENLFLIGRSGMHRYNNQDHSMLTAMLAVENAATGRRDKGNIWAVNTQGDYHEGG
jgi:protoporphyrinogen oxidase